VWPWRSTFKRADPMISLPRENAAVAGRWPSKFAESSSKNIAAAPVHFDTQRVRFFRVVATVFIPLKSLLPPSF
jgi:hypothetical protein